MKNLIAFLFLALPFGFTSFISALIAPFITWFYDESSYVKNVFRAMDKQGAALLGFSGLYTLSAECGNTNCRFCTVICKILNLIQKGHCEGAAKREGLK